MLNTFRTLAGSFAAKILLVFLVLSFGVWGIGDMLRAPHGNQTVATVGSESVTTREFQQELRRETDNIREALGDRYTPEAVKSFNIPQRVLQKLVSDKLLQLESEALGLVPSDDDVVRRIRANGAFQDKQGNFDKSIFTAHLQRLGLSEKAYIDAVRAEMAKGLLLDTLLIKTPVPDIEINTLLAAQEEQRDAYLYILSPSLITDVPQPADKDLDTYYHAHQSDFTAPEYRTVSYMLLTPADIHSNDAISPDELQAAYKDRIDEFKRPERRTVEQLLYPTQENAKAAADMLDKGKSVDDVAKALPPLNKDTLSLGKVERNTILENAAASVFSLPAGGHTAPIQSPFGWHVFHVTAIEPPATSPFEEVRPALEKDLQQRKSEEAQDKLANKLEDELAGGSTLAEVAAGQNLKVQSAGTFSRKGESPDGSKDASLPDLDKFVDTAFKTDEKSESGLMPAKGGNYYLLRVESVTPERLRALGEVKDKVVAAWQAQQRAARLGTLAAAIAKTFAASPGRDTAIAQYHLSPLPVATVKRSSHVAGTVAVPPDLIAGIFAHQPGENTAAVPLGDGTYAIAIVGKITPAPAPGKDPKLVAEAADIRHSVENTVGNEIMDQYNHYLMGKYPVSLNEPALQSVTP